MSGSSAEIIDLQPKRERSASQRPEAMIELPADNKALVRTALDIIAVCRADAGNRAAAYKALNQMIETGKSDGTRSLINLLYSLIDRLASHLFSPTDIRFSLDFENEYPDEILKRGQIAARLLARSFERTNTDMLFAQGVFESLKYGACFLKQWCRQEGPDLLPVYMSSLVMPWQFGVYRPDSNNLDSQPAMVETVMLTLPEVWRRISHMPDARALFDRIKQHAAPGNGNDLSNSFFHQVMSTSPIQTGIQGAQRPIPGGIVQLGNGDVQGSIGGSGVAPMVTMHELWMWERDDYCTIQIIEPDVLIAPRYKRSNLLISGETHSGLHPYTMIQANQTHGNIWGRSEIADLISPQDWISTTAIDIKRLLGVQFDKILAFGGSDGITDELYDQLRGAGYVNMGSDGKVQDLTPSFPNEALPLLDKLIQLVEMISGFDNLLSGKGESGVRSGVQANPLMKAAGARLKDRSLLIERQCASAADLRLSLMEAKDGRNYWVNAKKVEETSFLLADLPDDRRVVVDGHTTSPIFADDHQQLIIAGVKMGLVDKQSAVEQLPFENRDIILTRLHAAEEKNALLMEQIRKTDPEGFIKLITAGKHK